MLFDVTFSAVRVTGLIVLGFAATVPCWMVWIIYARTLHPLSRIPGPFLASVTRGWLVWHVRRSDMEQVQRALHAKHGKLVRISPNEIAYADATAIKKIYPSVRPLQKSEFYPAWDRKQFSKYPDLFSMDDEQLHSNRRRIVNQVYSLSNVLQSETYVDKCSALFVKRFDERADGAQVIDLGEWLQWYALDVIGELFFGRMFGFMENARDHDAYIESLDILVPTLLTVAIVPRYLQPFVFISALFSSSARRALKALEHITTAARTCVDQRGSEMTDGKSSGRRDLLHQLLEIVQQKGAKVDFGVPEVKNEIYTALFAGSDTTAVAMRAWFYFLMKNAKVYQQVQAEVDTAAADGQLTFPVKYADAIRLPLFCASLKEAMRLHPSVGLTMPRIAPAGGLELCGTHIPAGYRVGINGAVLGYDKSIYGSDASEFRPSRWLEGDAAMMERNSVVFGCGTRTCIGKNISVSEMHKLLP